VLHLDEKGSVDDEIDAAIFFTTSTENKVPCFKCQELGRPHSIFCKSCGDYASAIWKCQNCHLPTPVASDKCHQWARSGTQAKSLTPTHTEMDKWKIKFKASFDTAREKSKADRARGGGGGASDK